jgi:hypothetical protein
MSSPPLPTTAPGPALPHLASTFFFILFMTIAAKVLNKFPQQSAGDEDLTGVLSGDMLLTSCAQVARREYYAD